MEGKEALGIPCGCFWLIQLGLGNSISKSLLTHVQWPRRGEDARPIARKRCKLIISPRFTFLKTNAVLLLAKIPNVESFATAFSD